MPPRTQRKPIRVSSHELQEFFFEGMLQGYASQSSSMDAYLPGSKSHSYSRGDLAMVDSWFINGFSDRSYGTTVILVDRIPVWVMHYGGWYFKWVTPFLKRALARNYDKRVFLGGRGPNFLAGEDHTIQYLNSVEQDGFVDFRGNELIISTSAQTGHPRGTTLGEHHYFGGLMM